MESATHANPAAKLLMCHIGSVVSGLRPDLW